jgi:hypothetical protein
MEKLFYQMKKSLQKPKEHSKLIEFDLKAFNHGN